MHLATKLRKYLKDNGFQLKWFGEKLGMSKQQFYQVTTGNALLPRKYWRKIIILTRGKISLADILVDQLQKYEEIEVEPSLSADCCRVSLRNFYTEI
jgi:hypothetical protein